MLEDAEWYRRIGLRPVFILTLKMESPWCTRRGSSARAHTTPREYIPGNGAGMKPAPWWYARCGQSNLLELQSTEWQ